MGPIIDKANEDNAVGERVIDSTFDIIQHKYYNGQKHTYILRVLSYGI
jgi:hypothetical protein